MLPLLAGAQGKEHVYTSTDPIFETGARLDASLDINIIPKKLGMKINEEVRFDENFRHFQRSYTSIGIDGRILRWMKAGVNYSFIANNSASKVWEIRHRGTFHLTESIEAGRWEFDFRETFQMTHHTEDMNIYQSPKTELQLKARFKVSYDIPNNHFKPFFSAEARILLNGVNPENFVYKEEFGRWCNPDPQYNDVYFNRLRLKLGSKFRASKHNVLDFYAVADLGYDLDIDFNSTGNQKKSAEEGSLYAPYMYLQNSYFIGLGISYTFKL